MLRSWGHVALWLALLGLPALGGCSLRPHAWSRDDVSANVRCRTGHTLAAAPEPGIAFMPNGATLAGGLVEDEAVLIALWNNAAFQELLTELGIARGDLVQAGLLPNPEVIYFFHVPDKPFKYAVELPLDAFWLRPIREAAAARESARVGHRVTQAALDLIRDTRQAFADVLLARDRAKVAAEGVELRGNIARLAEIRLKEGDIAEPEAATARIEALQAAQLLARLSYESALAEERLRNLLGLPTDRSPLYLWTGLIPLYIDQDADALAADAAASRPDVLATDEAVAAARERLCLAKVGWVRFLGLLDATSGRDTGHEFGPAFRVTLPIFNWNQGLVARAEAELERAERNRQTVRNQVYLDVHLAHTRYAQSRAELQVLLGRVRPAVEEAIRGVRTAYEEGNVAYVVILETTRQLLDTHLREAELQAELRRAWAELERSVGRRLCPPTLPPPAPEKPAETKPAEKMPERLPDTEKPQEKAP